MRAEAAASAAQGETRRTLQKEGVRSKEGARSLKKTGQRIFTMNKHYTRKNINMNKHYTRKNIKPHTIQLYESHTKDRRGGSTWMQPSTVAHDA